MDTVVVGRAGEGLETAIGEELLNCLGEVCKAVAGLLAATGAEMTCEVAAPPAERLC